MATLTIFMLLCGPGLGKVPFPLGFESMSQYELIIYLPTYFYQIMVKMTNNSNLKGAYKYIAFTTWSSKTLVACEGP